jgi:hypothetical protein
MEVSLNVSPIQRPDWGWDVGTKVSTNHSEMVSLGGAPPFRVGRGFIREGEPVAVMMGRYVTNPTENADPVIEQNHIYGPSSPTLIWSALTSVRLPAGIVLSALGEYKGGSYFRVNVVSGMVSRGGGAPECFPYYTDLSQLGPPPNYIGGSGGVPQLKPDTPALWRARCDPKLVNRDYFNQPIDFFRLRTVSATIPLDFLFTERVNNAQLTLALNNSWTWHNSEWLTFDPELTRAEGLVDSDNNEVPPPIAFRVSLRVQF